MLGPRVWRKPERSYEVSYVLVVQIFQPLFRNGVVSSMYEAKINIPLELGKQTQGAYLEAIRLLRYVRSRRGKEKPRMVPP